MDRGLNEAQKQAVHHVNGPALVVAGAGTGKTRVITERIAHLIQEGHAKPQQILALTFTEKAAREMAERLYDLIGWHSYQVAVQTFHAFGSELLGRYASHIGRSVGGGLINDTQKALLLQQHLNRVELSYYGPQSKIFEFLSGVVDFIGSLQNSGISAEDYKKYVEALVPGPELHSHDIAEQKDLSALYSLYEAIKHETGTLDYNDQLQIPLHILQQKPNVAQRLAREYRYVLVDEYQDTNTLQDELLRAFIPEDGNLFAVGDDDQAIYGFRGAQIGNILAFAEHFKVKEPLALVENYRSGQEILDASYRLIKNNDPERLEAKLNLNKKLRAQRTGSKVEFTPYRTQSDEIESVQQAIERQIENGVQSQSIAVLASTHAPLSQMAKGMRSRGIPFALSTAVNIFDQPELIQLWYLLEWIGYRADEESVAHVLMGVFFGWTSEDYRKLLQRSREDMVPVEDLLRQDESELSKTAVEKLDCWREWAKADKVSYLAYRLVFETGVVDDLRNLAANKPRIRRVFEDLGQLLTQMQDFETVSCDPSLISYLQSFPKPPTIEVAEPMGDPEGVQLLTVHAAKGLEFDVVYLVGCTQRSWSPGRGSGWQIPPELVEGPDLPPEHELRRLMYVATTRARHELWISAAVQTAGGTRQTVTPFINELLGEVWSTKPQLPLDLGDEVATAVQKLQRFYPLQREKGEKLPFETGDGWIELGVGALGNYDFCPYDFYLEKVLGIAQPFGPQLAFGTALHGAIQTYYQGKLHNEDIGTEELLIRLNELWSDRGYSTKQQAEAAKNAAIQALNNFIARDRTSESKIIASEMPIKLEIPEVKLRLKGRIDAIFETTEGGELRDFKTGRKTNAEALQKAAKTSFQLRTYALAYEQMTGKPPAAVTLDYIVTGVEGRAELSRRIIDNHRNKLIQLAENIRAGEFSPKPSNVHQCAAIRYYGTGEEDELQEATRA